ncbi:hypothetical protein [Halorussus ruber]|uniref:hypothetical protein n=1 Tax=Halorussus ruber TaxID=1126238 RepID=UPI00143CC5CD|nr:hypothetical protein [Halorussus ruber]
MALGIPLLFWTADDEDSDDEDSGDEYDEDDEDDADRDSDEEAGRIKYIAFSNI